MVRGAAPGTRARLITGRPRPAGWAGKTWACAQLADASDAQTLVFCDADVLLAPGAAASVLGEMDRQQARGLFGVSAPPDRDLERAAAGAPDRRRAAVPGCRSACCGSRCRSSRDRARGAVRVPPRRVRGGGGFAAVRGEVVEDVALARVVRARGSAARDWRSVEPPRRCGCTGIGVRWSRASAADCAHGGRPGLGGGCSVGLSRARLYRTNSARCRPAALAARRRSRRCRAGPGGTQDRRPGLGRSAGRFGIAARRDTRCRAGLRRRQSGAAGATRHEPPATPAGMPSADQRTYVARPVPGPSRVLPGGHLPRWGRDAIALLEEGARLGPVFEVRLWRRALVGYRPEWNRMILGDLETFRSRGSMSQLSPYLRGGVIAQEAPAHRGRRIGMNATFHRRAITPLFSASFAEIVDTALPTGVFDAVVWASTLVRRLLGHAFFGPGEPPAELTKFLEPLDRGLPAPLLPATGADPADEHRTAHRDGRAAPRHADGRIRGTARAGRRRGRGCEGGARRRLRHHRAHPGFRAVGTGRAVPSSTTRRSPKPWCGRPCGSIRRVGSAAGSPHGPSRSTVGRIPHGPDGPVQPLPDAP